MILRRVGSRRSSAAGVASCSVGELWSARDFAEDLQAEVAAGLGPFVVLFGQDCADEADQGVAVGKMPTTSVRRISLLSRSWGLFDQIWRQIALGRRWNASRSARAASKWSATFRELVGQRLDDPIILGVNRFGVGLVEHRVQQGPHPARRPSG